MVRAGHAVQVVGDDVTYFYTAVAMLLVGQAQLTTIQHR